MRNRRVRHCRQTCKRHGHWCITEGIVHDLHRTDLCTCVWDSAGNLVLDLDAVVDANERRLTSGTDESTSEKSEPSDTKESHDNHGRAADSPTGTTARHRARTDDSGT